MADELISRQKIIKLLELLARHEDDFRQSVILGVVHTIKNIPAVNAVVLPCKVGDTVYVIWGEEIVEATVYCLRPFVYKDHTEFRGNAICVIKDPFFNDGRLMKHDLFVVFGFDTFLTREEAEATLKERREENAAD